MSRKTRDKWAKDVMAMHERRARDAENFVATALCAAGLVEPLAEPRRIGPLTRQGEFEQRLVYGQSFVEAAADGVYMLDPLTIKDNSC